MKQVAIPMEELMPILQLQMDTSGSALLTVTGWSMLPMLHNRKDTVTICPVTGSCKATDVILYQRDNGQYVLHRIVKVGETYTCIGDNQYQYETGVRHDQMIGLVTGFYRDQEYHSATELSHRVYRFLWHHSRWLRPRVQAVKSKIRRLIKK